MLTALKSWLSVSEADISRSSQAGRRGCRQMKGKIKEAVMENKTASERGQRSSEEKGSDREKRGSEVKGGITASSHHLRSQ